ncbi:MAG: cbiX [Phycisphaerales bacterium]|nr:cbiX [Phycisphaerales bacterium]
MKTGIIIVDHGSRRAQSNAMLEEVARLFGERFGQTYDVVEPAHMELAEPSIASAYARCAERGATRVVVVPFFLGPGKHWTGDIPRLTAEAARDHAGTAYHVTMPLGIDDLILDLLYKRATFCADHAYGCDSCRGTARSGEPGPAAAALAEPNGHDARLTDAHGMAVCGSCPYSKAVSEGATFIPAGQGTPAIAGAR